MSVIRVIVTNWHLFLPVDDESIRSVIKRGVESDRAFCKRTLKELWPKTNILVINDGAHHAYRPIWTDNSKPFRNADLGKDVEEEEYKAATVWVNGLDRINAVLGINFCLDMSATTYYIRDSGYGEGTPFPWIVSDFGLVDAIESGLVKIPRPQEDRFRNILSYGIG